MPATDRQPNRLVHETSPYLLQHAYNPVDWYPWGEEALQAAREQDKPIFLSIGYSACHWCHVMEHESFENDEIAGLMNQWFVNIKVDREERPDLDQIYMQAVIAQTGQGGWPMSVFLDHDLRCFYGGTYWPPEQRFGRPGFRDVLAALHEAWSNQRDGLIDRGNRVTEAVREMSLPRGETSELNADLLEKAARTLLRAADRTHGGFGGAPKFPHPMDIRLLLRAWKRFGMEDALHVARFTLDKMAAGGIYDHLGGGFHRYATDARWLVPHFEKMLYDNALLVPAYLEAYQAAGDADDVRVVRETLDYILREMTQPEGGFYSTQDADSEGVEGKFFVWTEDEIIRLLGHDDARVFNACYDVTPQGNWDDPHGHAPPGPNNILNRPKPLDQMAKDLGLDEQEMTAILDRGRKTLLAAREQRVAPGRDEKVLASWNGLMIAAMAQAAQVLDEPRYAEAARAAAAFILEQMREPDGRLLHSYKDGRARFNGHLDDYAGLIDGLVELYQATFEPRWLEAAAELADRMIAQFGDAEAGGFFYTSVDHEELLVRQKDSQDGATPAGNSLAATALLKLARLSGRADFEEQAVGTLQMLSGQMASIAAASGQAMLALDFLLGPTYEVAVAAGESPGETQQVLRTVHARFMPNKVVAVHQADAENAGIVEPLFEGRPPEAGRATVYLCRQGTCGLPIVGNETLQQEWEGITAQSASP